MPEVLLGVFAGYMNQKRNMLTSDTKIGGTPIYFPPLSASQMAEIQKWRLCCVCGHQMFLVLQAFSPLPSASSSHNRMLYVFCCNRASCATQPSSSWCAFTLQVDAVDERALADDEDNYDGDNDFCVDNNNNNNNNNNVNEIKDYVVHVDPLTVAELPPNTFPPCYVDIISEPKKEIVVLTDLESDIIRAAEENARRSGITEDDIKELEETIDLKDKPSDYEFEKFRKKIAREPTQVIRYYVRKPVQTKEEDCTSSQIARPLFMNSKLVTNNVRVPPCDKCGAARIHELQIMPTCVYYLRVGQYVEQSTSPSTFSSSFSCAAGVKGGNNYDEGVDWGTVTVFVCSRDCLKDVKGVVLQREFLLVERAPELQDEIKEAGNRSSLLSFMT